MTTRSACASCASSDVASLAGFRLPRSLLMTEPGRTDALEQIHLAAAGGREKGRRIPPTSRRRDQRLAGCCSPTSQHRPAPIADQFGNQMSRDDLPCSVCRLVDRKLPARKPGIHGECISGQGRTTPTPSGHPPRTGIRREGEGGSSRGGKWRCLHSTDSACSAAEGPLSSLSRGCTRHTCEARSSTPGCASTAPCRVRSRGLCGWWQI